ncbi:MAG TPA: type II and III secretion system protein [Methylomirabilota bacterium]|nr:type II and III secretion system protein [Methylomirabilota bacterium]
MLTYGQQPKTNTLFLYGLPDEVQKAATVLRKADRDPLHVVIEALVVEFDVDAFEQFTADIAKLSEGPYSNIITNFGSLTENALNFTYMPGAHNRTELMATINALVAMNKARLISRPYVATLSGETANINITRDRYVVVQTAQNGATITTTNPVSSGITLNITPTILPDEQIRMQVDVEDSLFIPTVQNVAVEVDKNAAQTVMRVASGQAIVIGGLTLNRHTTGNSGAPWLRHVPGVNLLFSDQELTRNKQEVVIYLTPHLWSPDLQAPLIAPATFGIREEEGNTTDSEKRVLDSLRHSLKP